MDPRCEQEPRQEVILLRGRGKKRALNNSRAVVLSKGRGGWATVKTIPSGNLGQEDNPRPIKWRNKAWRFVETHSQANNLEIRKDMILSLGDDCLVKIFSFLGAGQNPPEAYDSMHNDPSGELMDIDVAPESVKTVFSLPEAMALHQTLALACKRFYNTCRHNLPPILGRLDADLIQFTWWRYVPWMVKHKIALRSIKLKGFVLTDAVILLHLLRSCDVSELTTLVALFDNNDRDNALSCEQSLLFHALVRQTDSFGTVNIDSPCFAGDVGLSMPQLFRKLGFPPSITEVTSRRTLFNEVENHCPKLRSLKVFLLDGESTVDIPHKSRIINLHLVLNYPQNRRGRKLDLNGVTKVVRQLPALSFLKLSITSQSTSNGEFHLASPSLRYLNVEGLCKGGWITQCRCPSLRRIVCRGSTYGNGVRPRGENGELDFFNLHESEFLAGNTRFDGSLPAGFGGYVSEGLDVPDSCLVVLRNEWY